MSYNITGPIPSSIEQIDNVIQLKQYVDNLGFYASFESTLDANYFKGIKTPATTGTITFQSSAPFGQLALFDNATAVYDKTNFTGVILNQGTIQFRVQAFYNNARGYQEFTALTPTVPSNGTYGFKLAVNGVNSNISFAATTTSSMLALVSNINAVLPVTASASLSVNNKIRITSINFGDTILISTPVSGNNFITVMGGVDAPRMPNANTTDVNLITLGEVAGDNNKIILTHKTDSSIWLKMYNSTGVLIVNQKVHDWDNNNTTYYAFELDFNETIGQFYLDGVMKSIFQTGFVRTDSGQLTLSSGTTQYKFDELIIYKTYQNNRNFTIATSNLSQYSTAKPYVDLKFTETLNLGDVTSAIISATFGTSFVASIGGVSHYYLGDGWHTSDGTFAQSTDLTLFQEKFPELNFNGQILIVRVFFASDGNTPQSISAFDIIEDVTNAKPATLTGGINLNTPVDLSTYNKIKITTSAGSYDVTLTGANQSAVTLEEIKNSINNAHIPLLAPAADDSNGRLVLFTTDTGDSAILVVDNAATDSALSLVWGAASSVVGTEETNTLSLDYTEIKRYIRSYLGAPIAPVELTEEHLQDCVSYAVYYYNYYRNSKNELLRTALQGDPNLGFTLPVEVGGEENIVEVFFRPGYPFNFFTGTDDLMSQIYINWFFQNYKANGLNSLASDYFVSLSTMQDLGNVLGTNITLRFFGGKMYITPKPPEGATIGIVFKSAATISEINTNIYIKKLAIARAKQILGTIRGTFGGIIPGGTENLVLRGETLISEGKEEESQVLIELQKLQEPLFLEYG